MENRRNEDTRGNETDITKTQNQQRPQGGEASGDSWKSDSENADTGKPGQTAAANEEDDQALEDEGVADGS